jgi:gamma-glutamyltranspeptidase/glutathione hydrolase
MQPQGHLQVVIALADDGLDPQSVLDQLRFCITDGMPGGIVALEEGIPKKVAKRLVSMGHTVEVVTGYPRSLFGRGQIILRDPTSGVLWGASDPRADGCAMGF